MKFKYWVWKSLVFVIFISSFIFINYQFPSSTQYYFYFNIGICNLVLGVLMIFPPKWDMFLSFILITIISFYTWGQSVYLRSFNQLAYLNTAFSLKNEATKSISSIIEFVLIQDLKYLIFPMLMIILLIVSWKINISKIRNKKNILFSLFILICISIFFIVFAFNSIEASRLKEEDFFYYKTDHYLFYSKPSSLIFLEKFGLNMWLFKDIYDVYLYPLISNSDFIEEEINVFLTANIDSKKSTLSGVFEGKSLLLIEAESLNNYAIDPTLTPTLYRLLENGYHFPNYHSPLLLGSTSDAELMVNTGLLPPENGYITFLKYFDNEFPTTLAKEFNEEEYFSIAAHNNYGEFYNRDVVYPNLGYTFYDCIDMGFETQFIDDSRYIEILTWILIEKPQFLSYWITFNGHQPYNTENLSERINLNLITVKQTYPDIPKAQQIFLAKNMDLDQGLAYLIDVFTYMNRIDDLVIIIYGDHAPKGIFEDGIEGSKDCTSIGYTDEQCLNTPLIIWHKDEFVGKSLTVSNPTDISPTIYDLFGIEYATENVFGTSIFSDSYEGFYFDANGNIITNQFNFNFANNQILETNIIKGIDYNSTLSILKNKMKIYRNIIEIDYFNK